MAHIELQSKVQGRSAQDVYALMSNLESYAKCGAAVRSLTVARENGKVVSTWEVTFHGGIMKWTEEDIFMPEEHALKFHQIDGDMDSFNGEWRITDTSEGCVVDYRVEFDLGLPGLSSILEPIAMQALRDNTRGILTALVAPSPVT
jgi:ribosome-associated toxin RatA of RatAB toxin-antitoxin module